MSARLRILDFGFKLRWGAPWLHRSRCRPDSGHRGHRQSLDRLELRPSQRTRWSCWPPAVLGLPRLASRERRLAWRDCFIVPSLSTRRPGRCGSAGSSWQSARASGPAARLGAEVGRSATSRCDQAEKRASTLHPIVAASVDLQEGPFLRHPVPAVVGPGRTAWSSGPASAAAIAAVPSAP